MSERHDRRRRRAPPAAAGGGRRRRWRWLRRNLFGAALDARRHHRRRRRARRGCSSLVVDWALTEARWGVITDNLRLFLVGQYPADRGVARLAVPGSSLSVARGRCRPGRRARGSRTLAIDAGGWPGAASRRSCWPRPIGLVGGRRPGGQRGAGAGVGVRDRRSAFACRGERSTSAWLASLPVVLPAARRASAPTAAAHRCSTNVWGGLLLTVLLAVVGIVLSFPLGVLLALGRRSRLPGVRILSTAYIEIVRGVPARDDPLPGRHHAAAVPARGDAGIDRVVRAMGGITLFSAAYVAENVRGGLQAIPSRPGRGGPRHRPQRPSRPTSYIVLPQALRIGHPGQRRACSSACSRTRRSSSIVGLLELLGIGRAVLAQPEWFGAAFEVYAFVAVVFFVLCYAMSRPATGWSASWAWASADGRRMRRSTAGADADAGRSSSPRRPQVVRPAARAARHRPDRPGRRGGRHLRRLRLRASRRSSAPSTGSRSTSAARSSSTASS